MSAATTRLWDARRFATEPAPPRAPFVVQSRFAGVLLAAAAAPAAARALLPPDLECVPAPGGDDARHPLLFLAGFHDRCVGLVGGAPFGRAAPYAECIALVPFVRRRGSPAAGSWVAGMYSSAPLTVWAGNALYGFDKRLAQMRVSDDLLLVSDAAGALLAVVRAAAGGRGEADADGYAALRDAAALPLLGRTADGRLWRSWLQWDDAGAALAPARGYVALHAPLGALPPGEWDALPGGAFTARDLTWRLTLPLPA